MVGTLATGCEILALLAVLAAPPGDCYEKTLRKIVRNQSKMVQRAFSERDGAPVSWRNATPHQQAISDSRLTYSGFAQMWPLFHRIQRPKMSTVVSALETGRQRGGYTAPKTVKSLPERPMSSVFFSENSTKPDSPAPQLAGNDIRQWPMIKVTSVVTTETYQQVPVSSKFFPPVEEQELQSIEQRVVSKENIIIPSTHDASKENSSGKVKAIFIPNASRSTVDGPARAQSSAPAPVGEDAGGASAGGENEGADFLIEATSASEPLYNYNISKGLFTCKDIKETKADIDAQEQFLGFDLEPTWMSKKHFWNSIFDSRYVSLMRNPKWPPLKVILIPLSHVDAIWKQPFDGRHGGVAARILSNMVKKLQYYAELSFTWNEVAHLSRWWTTTSSKSRAGLRKLLKSGRLEITTGGWVEPDEASTHLFGLVHLLFEGHQWLKSHLNYRPKTAWLTNSFTHSPTTAYLLTACDIQQLIFTNLHFSWEQFLAEYQYSDFIWIQNWDTDMPRTSTINEALNKIGHERYPNHAVLAHYLQFNSGSVQACGPEPAVCAEEFDFAKSSRDMDINTYNVKAKAEKLLEQYSKTGTVSPHNVIIAPLGGPYRYQVQAEFDYQYNNYRKIAEFINTNTNIYKATVEFGTPKDYFTAILQNQRDYPTLKGDFFNFADLTSGAPAYWVGAFTSRPSIKILLRRLEATLRSTEILFSFAVGINAFQGYNTSNILELLTKARETAARLMDRHVSSGTVTAFALKYVQNQILYTVKNCWHIQEVAASFMSAKPRQTDTSFLQTYVYRDGEFMSGFKTVSPGDQIYVFNSFSQERTEIIDLVTQSPNIRIVDHNRKDVTVQINPIWKYTTDNSIMISQEFFGLNFAIVMPPMTLELFSLKETHEAVLSAASVHCSACVVDEERRAPGATFPFDPQPLQSGDVQLENYRHRLIFDELTGFLKTIVEKQTNTERTVSLDYGAFRESSVGAGMFLFNTNTSKPFPDPLRRYRLGVQPKLTIIVSGLVATHITSIFGRLLQHSVKIYNLAHSPLSKSIYVESKVDYEVSPKNRDLEMFLSIQTDIWNGNPSRIYTDNNGFQFTARLLNLSRRIESNMYPMTSMSFLQDKKSRLTVITDHAQGVTSLKEGQLVAMLDRRVLYDDGRGTGEGLADSTITTHRHVLLFENLITPAKHPSSPNLVLPSASAVYLSNALNYPMDVFIVDHSHSGLAHYTFLPMLKTSFPCDVTVLTYRVSLGTETSRKDSPSSAYLVLHRHGISCQIEESVAVQFQGENTFDIGKIFRNVKAVYQTNLPGTSDGVPATDFDHVNFPPMQLTTLRIHFEPH